MRITVPMPMYMSVLSVGSLLCVYPLALCLVPCQANTDEYLPERERPVRNDGTESGGKQLSSDIMTLDDLRELLRLRGVAFRGHHAPVPADEPLDRLAQELGHGLERLGELPRVLRRAATTHRPQTLRLRDETAEVVGAATPGASRLPDQPPPSVASTAPATLRPRVTRRHRRRSALSRLAAIDHMRCRCQA